MKVKFGAATLSVLLILALLSVAAPARHGPGARRTWSPMEPFEPVLDRGQRQMARKIVAADRTKLAVLRERLNMAREALVAKLLSPGKEVDTSKEAAELKSALGALVDERINIALQVRKLLSPEQLARAAQLHAKLKELRAQERQLLEKARKAPGSSSPSLTGQGAPVVPQKAQ